jgi:hypothetical protein
MKILDRTKFILFTQILNIYQENYCEHALRIQNGRIPRKLFDFHPEGRGRKRDQPLKRTRAGGSKSLILSDVELISMELKLR